MMSTRAIAAGAGSNYRIRLFWKWQAWRLRKAAAAEASRSVSVLANFAALDHRGYADMLCTLLETLCARAGGEVVTTAAQARERLKREMGPQSCAAVLASNTGSVGGYAWARVASGSETVANFRQAPGLAAFDEADWAALAALVADKPTLAFYDIGLDTHYRRGFSPLKLLLKPLFELGVTYRAKHALWWAQDGSALHAISLAFGARSVLERDGNVFLLHSDIASIAHILAVLPASAISDLLARVAPGRPVRTRDANAPVRAIRDPQLPVPAEADAATLPQAAAPAVAASPETAIPVVAALPVMASLAAPEATASNDADGADAFANGYEATALPLDHDVTTNAGEASDAEAAWPAILSDPAPLHALPARLAALFPRLAS
jgi:hypothetical protein